MFSSVPFNLAPLYASLTLKTRPTLPLAGWVRTEIADCVTRSLRDSVQLFYLCAINGFRHRV